MTADRPLRRLASTIALAGILASMTAAPGFTQALGSSWAITGATLIDGTGAGPRPAAVIIGRGSRIACAGSSSQCPVPEGAAVVDVSGSWVVPGLIDTHVHLNLNRGDAEENQRIRLAFGVTTTREAGTSPQLDAYLSWRQRVSLPSVSEPRLVVSGLVSKENAQRFGTRSLGELVRKYVGLGADAIKIKQVFSREDLRAIVEAADEGGLPVFGHTWDQSGSGLEAAVAAGVDGLSHMATFAEFAEPTAAASPSDASGAEYWMSHKEKWNNLDETRLRLAIDRAAAGHVWFEPLLVTEKYFMLPYPVPDAFDYLVGIPSVEHHLRSWLPVGDSGWVARRDRQRRLGVTFKRMCDFVREFHERGGIVVTGTDEVQPGLALFDEVQLLADCGLSPMAALGAATREAAAALGFRDGGTVEAGKVADFLILESDPLRDLGHLRQIRRVVKGGHQYDPASLLRPKAEAFQTALRRAWVLRTSALILGVIVAILISRFVWRYRSRRAYGS